MLLNTSTRPSTVTRSFPDAAASVVGMPHFAMDAPYARVSLRLAYVARAAAVSGETISVLVARRGQRAPRPSGHPLHDNGARRRRDDDGRAGGLDGVVPGDAARLIRELESSGARGVAVRRSIDGEAGNAVDGPRDEACSRLQGRRGQVDAHVPQLTAPPVQLERDRQA